MESPILTAVFPAMARVGKGSIARGAARRFDHDAIKSFVAGGRTIDEAVAEFGCSKTLAYNITRPRRDEPRAIDARFALFLSPVEPPPVWHNGVDVSDVDRCLDRGERLKDLARDWGLKSAAALVGRASGGSGAIGLAEADRRLKSGEGPMNVAFRARTGTAVALYSRLKSLELDRQIERVGAVEREAAAAASEDAAIPAPKAKRVYPKLTSREVWPEERVDRLAMLWAKGLSASNCAEKIGVTTSQVKGIAKRRRDAGDVRFHSRLAAEPEDKDETRRVLGAMVRTLFGDVPFGKWTTEAVRHGLRAVEGPWIMAGEWHRFSPARMMQILQKLGAEVQVEAAVGLNGVAERIILPLNGRSPI